ncbi:MAG: arylsulfatase [Rikenellaceae bacterium]
MKNLRPILPVALTAVALLPSSQLLAKSSKKSTTPSKPNIVFIITDDQGMGDLGCMGNPYIKTPNIDNFYQDAVRLTNYHVSTTSAPSRSSIMTGRHCNRVNAFHTIAGRSIIFNDEVTLAQVLAQNGYTNAMYGKWHLGDNYPNRPEDRGFHEVVRHGGGGVGQGPDYWSNDYFDDTYYHNGIEQKYEGYCTDVFFDEALDFIEKNQENPFFCYIATNAPHSPYNVPEKYLDIYQGDEFEKVGERTRRFYGMITNIDENFKRLEDKLDKLGLTENTILIFTTDNGTAAGASTFNAGLKGGKGAVTDGGHRVPFIVRWPNGEITGGQDIDNLLAHYDLLPTFVELTDSDFSPAKPLDGKSFAKLFNDHAAEWENRILYMDTQREQNLIKYKSYVVMDDTWRLINGNALYNINEDRAQQNNVIEEHPEVAARLAEGYERWWDSLMADNLQERSSYIMAGSPKENPVRISSHDMHIGEYFNMWHQNHVLNVSPGTGLWKVQFLESGNYTISVCRFPRESGFEINATFPAQEKERKYDSTAPASTKDDFAKATLYVAGKKCSADIAQGDKEISFDLTISEGKYDLYANLVDSQGFIYPAYYLYIEKK